MRATYTLFQTTNGTLEGLLDEAAAFASELGPKRLINITTHENRFTWRPTIVVAVWHWDEKAESAAY